MRQDASELCEVSSRRLYNIASLGGTADQLKNEISYISLHQSLPYTYSLPEVYVHYDGETPRSQPLFVSYRSRRDGNGIISIGHMVIMIAII